MCGMLRGMTRGVRAFGGSRGSSTDGGNHTLSADLYRCRRRHIPTMARVDAHAKYPDQSYPVASVLASQDHRVRGLGSGRKCRTLLCACVSRTHRARRGRALFQTRRCCGLSTLHSYLCPTRRVHHPPCSAQSATTSGSLTRQLAMRRRHGAKQPPTLGARLVSPVWP